MKHFIIFILVSLHACKVDFEDINHTIVEVNSGNSVTLNNGIKVNLIGVHDTQEGKAFLEETILGEQVNVVFDRYHYPDISKNTTSVDAYIIDLRGQSVNGNMLRRKLSTLNNNLLVDSLEAFKHYLSSSTTQIIEQRNDVAKKVDREEKSSFSRSTDIVHSSFPDLVAYVEKCAFLVISKNEFNEGMSQGTGFFIDQSGIGVSNYHVLEGGSQFAIKTSDGEILEINEILASDKEYDIVIFRVAGNNREFPSLSFADQVPKKGADIFVVGNPKGLESTLTTGIVSAIREYKGQQTALVQIDAAISHGSSGSPVLNMKGEVIGIATMKIDKCENCNFAINSKLIQANLHNIRF